LAQHVPLSVLDHVSVSEGQTQREAIAQSLDTAQLLDRLGFNRLWFGEHHNMNSLASAANSILIGQAASVTERIRVGSGGVMLPNYSPLQVAENFGTLSQLFPDRIDLGLGRAPGTDGRTAQLLIRSGADPQSFANAILDLTGWFSEQGLAHSVPVTSNVGTGTKVPMWVLGSSMNGASIAGQLGLPYAVASHFAPDNTQEKIELYRSSFTTTQQTTQIDTPYAMAGINVLVAPTDGEAQRLWTTTQQFLADAQTGKERLMQPPVEPDEIGTAQVRTGIEAMFSNKAVGSPETVRQQLEEFVQRSGADELIVVTYTYDPEDRKRSMQLLADLWF